MLTGFNNLTFKQFCMICITSEQKLSASVGFNGGSSGSDQQCPRQTALRVQQEQNEAELQVTLTSADAKGKQKPTPSELLFNL